MLKKLRAKKVESFQSLLLELQIKLHIICFCKALGHPSLHNFWELRWTVHHQWHKYQLKMNPDIYTCISIDYVPIRDTVIGECLNTHKTAMLPLICARATLQFKSIPGKPKLNTSWHSHLGHVFIPAHISCDSPFVAMTVKLSPHDTWVTFLPASTPLTKLIPGCSLKSPKPNCPYLLHPKVSSCP